MKKELLVIIIFLALVIGDTVAQKDTSNDVIILANGDTLFSPQIIKNKALTNQDQILYFDGQKRRQKLNASQVHAYFFNNESFHSELIKSDDLYRLINYEVGGYIGFGLSYTSKGDMNFYVKKNGEVIALEKYKYDLKSFFINYMLDFDQFYAKYKVKISYDFKTLAEMISAYNAFKYPDQYVFEPIMNKDKVNVGVIASGGMMNTNLSGYLNARLNGGSFSFGMDLETKYSRYFAIHIPMTYNMASSKATNISIHLSTLNFEPFLTLRTIPKKKINFEIGAGLGMMYSLNSYLDCSSLIESDQEKVKFNKLSFGTNLSVIANLDRKLRVQLMFVQYQTHSASIKKSYLGDTSVKARINNLRLMIFYYF